MSNLYPPSEISQQQQAEYILKGTINLMSRVLRTWGIQNNPVDLSDLVRIARLDTNKNILCAAGRLVLTTLADSKLSNVQLLLKFIASTDFSYFLQKLNSQQRTKYSNFFQWIQTVSRHLRHDAQYQLYYFIQPDSNDKETPFETLLYSLDQFMTDLLELNRLFPKYKAQLLAHLMPNQPQSQQLHKIQPYLSQQTQQPSQLSFYNAPPQKPVYPFVPLSADLNMGLFPSGTGGYGQHQQFQQSIPQYQQMNYYPNTQYGAPQQQYYPPIQQQIMQQSGHQFNQFASSNANLSFVNPQVQQQQNYLQSFNQLDPQSQNPKSNPNNNPNNNPNPNPNPNINQNQSQSQKQSQTFSHFLQKAPPPPQNVYQSPDTSQLLNTMTPIINQNQSNIFTSSGVFEQPIDSKLHSKMEESLYSKDNDESFLEPVETEPEPLSSNTSQKSIESLISQASQAWKSVSPTPTLSSLHFQLLQGLARSESSTSIIIFVNHQIEQFNQLQSQNLNETLNHSGDIRNLIGKLTLLHPITSSYTQTGFQFSVELFPIIEKQTPHPIPPPVVFLQFPPSIFHHFHSLLYSEKDLSQNNKSNVVVSTRSKRSRSGKKQSSPLPEPDEKENIEDIFTIPTPINMCIPIQGWFGPFGKHQVNLNPLLFKFEAKIDALLSEMETCLNPIAYIAHQWVEFYQGYIE